MSRRGVWFVVLVVGGALVPAAGCSVIFDTESYREEPGEGPVPSTPEVSITPADPTTLQDLRAVIDMPSEDPLSQTVTYRYEWLRDDTATTITTDTVPAAETAKGEVWTLRVTPVAGTPERAGVAGEATVTIGNLPPTLGYARLSRYEVWQDETIVASPGDATDPDAENLTVTYEWRVNGLLSTATTNAFEVAALAPGDEVSVTLRVSDGTAMSDEAHSAGPAVVRAPEGWRQLEPNQALNAAVPLFFADPERGRMLFFREGALWEYRVTGSRSVPWAKLNLTNVPDLHGCSVFYDAAESRFLIWGGVDFSSEPRVPNETLYELAIPGPGLETLREVPTSMTPPPRFAHVSINDPERERGIILGGGVPDDVPFEFTMHHDDVWQLDYSTPDPTFLRLFDTAITPLASFMASATDTSSGVAYLFGGFSSAGMGLDGVYAYDLEEDEIVELGERLSSGRGGIGAVDMQDGTALLIDGSPALIGQSLMMRAEVFDYATQASTPVTLTGTRPTQIPRPHFERFGDSVRWFTGNLASDLFVYELDGLDAQPQSGPNVNVPGPTVGANVISGSGPSAGLMFSFGRVLRDFDRAVSDGTFVFDGSTWARVAGLSGTEFARWGASGIVSGSNGVTQLFGGSPTLVVQTDIISSATGSWMEVRPDDAALHASISGDFARPAWRCGNQFRVLMNNATYALDATGALPGAALTAGVDPPPVNLTAAGYEGLAPSGGAERIVVFGGSSSSEWFTTLPCGVADDWVAQTPVGGPVGRFAPAIAKRKELTGSNTNQLLLFGGASGAFSNATPYNDLWLVTMDSAGTITVEELEHPSFPAPAPRFSAMLGWNVFGQRALLFGGEGPGGLEFPNTVSSFRADTWEYRLPEGI